MKASLKYEGKSNIIFISAVSGFEGYICCLKVIHNFYAYACIKLVFLWSCVRSFIMIASVACQLDSIIISPLLSVWTKEKQRAVIRFLFSDDVKSTEIHRRLSQRYEDNVLKYRFFVDREIQQRSDKRNIKRVIWMPFNLDHARQH